MRESRHEFVGKSVEDASRYHPSLSFCSGFPGPFRGEERAGSQFFSAQSGRVKQRMGGSRKGRGKVMVATWLRSHGMPWLYHVLPIMNHC